MRVLGVFRELQNSPNRETDDARVLGAVLEELSRSGLSAESWTPERLDADDPAGWDLILPMCESYTRLMRLSSLRGPLILNEPAAVLNCYRTRMASLLGAAPETGFPPTEIRRVEGDGVEGGARPSPPAIGDCVAGGEGWWIKRGDVHNTCDHDVVRIASWDRLPPVLADFQAREITHYVVQPHVPGDLVKFYGVGAGSWFTWFYHDPAAARRLPFEREALGAAAEAAARAVGLEIFGGDAIVSPGGAVSVIDVNSWPSFARVRPEAAVQIARHAVDRLRALPAERSRSS